MPYLQMNIPIPDDSFRKHFGKLYALAKSLGYSYPETMKDNPNLTKMGERLAIARMFGDIVTGKLKVTKSKE